MKVKSVEIKEITRSSVVRDNEVNVTLKVDNGFNKVHIIITKENLKYQDIVDLDADIKVIFYARNCCRATPMLILDGSKEKDREELTQVINDVLELSGEEIKANLLTV